MSGGRNDDQSPVIGSIFPPMPRYLDKKEDNMRHSSYRLIIILTTVILGVLATIIWLANKRLSQMIAHSQVTPRESKTRPGSQDPCELYKVFNEDKSINKEGYNHQILLRMHGYSAEIPLTQAVDDFNKMAQCHTLGKTQPSLTVEELLAAIRSCNRFEEKTEPWVFETYQKISKTEMLPKGTYIDYGQGYINLNGYDIRAWSIILYVGLDRYPRDIKGNPFYMRFIRRQYISSEPTKFKSKEG